MDEQHKNLKNDIFGLTRLAGCTTVTSVAETRCRKGGMALTGCIYTPEEIAERWRCSSVTVYRLLNAGKLEGFRVGRS